MLAGEVQATFVETSVVMGQIRDRQIIPLAITGAVRGQQLPTVPTVAEAGLAGYEAMNGFALFAPAGTPAPILRRIDTASKTAMRHPEVAPRLASLAMVPSNAGPDEFPAIWAAEAAKWGALIRAHNIRAS